LVVPGLLHVRGSGPAEREGPVADLSGCSDGGGARTLTGANYYSASAMTAAACVAFCESRGFVFAGTEYSTECCESGPRPTLPPLGC